MVFVEVVGGFFVNDEVPLLSSFFLMFEHFGVGVFLLSGIKERGDLDDLLLMHIFQCRRVGRLRIILSITESLESNVHSSTPRSVLKVFRFFLVLTSYRNWCYVSIPP